MIQQSLKRLTSKLTSKLNYLDLEKAIEFLTADKIEDKEYESVIVPPDFYVVSYEEEGNEEEGNEDYLVSSTFPNNVRGTLELISRHRNVSNCDDSDYEPLCSSQ